MRTRSLVRVQRSLSTRAEKETAETVGNPIFIEAVAVADVPCTPWGSTALFSEKQLTWCAPIPLTGTSAVL